MPIPDEFYNDAIRLGYGEGGWSNLEHAFDENERCARARAAEHGFAVWREGRQIYGSRNGDEFLLATALPGEDPMNLWVNAAARIELIDFV